MCAFVDSLITPLWLPSAPFRLLSAISRLGANDSSRRTKRILIFQSPGKGNALRLCQVLDRAKLTGDTKIFGYWT